MKGGGATAAPPPHPPTGFARVHLSRRPNWGGATAAPPPHPPPGFARVHLLRRPPPPRIAPVDFMTAVLSLREGHAGVGVHRQRRPLTRLETVVPGRGDHRRIVGAERARGNEELPASLAALGLERVAERRVRGDPAR